MVSNSNLIGLAQLKIIGRPCHLHRFQQIFQLVSFFTQLFDDRCFLVLSCATCLSSLKATDSSKNNVQPIEFYRKIWNKLCSYCRNDKETAYVLFVLVDHDLIPYRNVGIGISMSDEDYAAGAKKIRTTIFKDTMYIFSLRYEEKTQQASLLLDQLLSLEDKNLQTIYMSMIIQLVERNIKDRLKDCIDEA